MADQKVVGRFILIDNVSRRAEKIAKQMKKLENQVNSLDDVWEKVAKVQKASVGDQVRETDKAHRRISRSFQNLNEKIRQHVKQLDAAGQANRRLGHDVDTSARMVDRSTTKMNRWNSVLQSTAQRISQLGVATERQAHALERMESASIINTIRVLGNDAERSAGQLKMFSKAEDGVTKASDRKNKSLDRQTRAIERDHAWTGRLINRLEKWRIATGDARRALDDVADFNFFRKGFVAGAKFFQVWTAVAAILPIIGVTLGGIGQMINGLASGITLLGASLGRLSGILGAVPGMLAAIGAANLGIRGITSAIFQPALQGHKQLQNTKQQLEDAKHSLAIAQDVHSRSKKTAADNLRLQASQQRVNELQKEYNRLLKEVPAGAEQLNDKIQETKMAWFELWRGGGKGVDAINLAIMAMGNLQKFFRAIQPSVDKLFNTLFRAAHDLTEALVNPQVQRFANQTLGMAADNLQVFWDIAKNLAPLMGAILNSSQRFVGVLADSTNHWAKGYNQTEKMQKAVQMIDRFFARSATTLHRTMDVLKNIGGGLANIFRAAAPWTNQFENDLVSITERFKEWTARSQPQIQRFFQNTYPILQAMGRLVVSIFTAFGELSGARTESATEGVSKSTSVMVAFIDQLGRGLVQFAGFARKSLEKVGPSLIAFWSALGSLLSQISPASIVIVATGLNIVASVMKGIAKLAEAIPGIKLILGGLIALRIFMFALGLFVGNLAAMAVRALKAAALLEAIRKKGTWRALKDAATGRDTDPDGPGGGLKPQVVHLASHNILMTHPIPVVISPFRGRGATGTATSAVARSVGAEVPATQGAQIIQLREMREGNRWLQTVAGSSSRIGASIGGTVALGYVANRHLDSIASNTDVLGDIDSKIAATNQAIEIQTQNSQRLNDIFAGPSSQTEAFAGETAMRLKPFDVGALDNNTSALEDLNKTLGNQKPESFWKSFAKDASAFAVGSIGGSLAFRGLAKLGPKLGIGARFKSLANKATGGRLFKPGLGAVGSAVDDLTMHKLNKLPAQGQLSLPMNEGAAGAIGRSRILRGIHSIPGGIRSGDWWKFWKRGGKGPPGAGGVGAQAGMARAGTLLKIGGPLAAAVASPFVFKGAHDSLKGRKSKKIGGGIGAVGGGILGGVAGGAAVGAAAGTVVPGVGNVVGAIAGAIIGGIAGTAFGKRIGAFLGPILTDNWEHLLLGLAGPLSGLSFLIEKVFGVNIPEEIWKGLIKAVDYLRENWPHLLLGPFTALSAIIEEFFGVNIPGLIGSGLQTIWSEVTSGIGSAVDWVVGKIDWLREKIGKIPSIDLDPGKGKGLPGKGRGGFLKPWDGWMPGFAGGGVVPHTAESTPGKDSVHAKLTPGEVVLNEKQQKTVGKSKIAEALKGKAAGKSPQDMVFASGGTVTAGRAKGAVWPTNPRGRVIGTPYSGTHTLGNWQSDNALDIGVPVGSKIIAVTDAVVNKVKIDPSQDGSSRYAGDQVTISGGGNSWFYTHLLDAFVQTGQKVAQGQVIGTGGAANGVPHLHIGQKYGDPRSTFGGMVSGFSGGDGKAGALGQAGEIYQQLAKIAIPEITGEGSGPLTDQAVKTAKTVRDNLQKAADAAISKGNEVLKGGPGDPSAGVAGWAGGAVPPDNPSAAKSYALWALKNMFGFDTAQFDPLNRLWTKESGWKSSIVNKSSGAYGIPQCVEYDTLILTKRGWLAHDEVEVGDETIGYNTETGKSEWTVVEEVLHPGEHEVWEIDTAFWSARSTPNHRWLMERMVNDKPVSEEMVKLQENEGRKHRLVLSKEADTGEGLDITIEEAALLGWIAGDGWEEKKKVSLRKTPDRGRKMHHRPATFFVSQTKKEHWRHIEWSLGDEKNWSITRTRNGHREWRISAPYSRDLIARAGHPKKDAVQMVLRMSPEQRESWLEAIIRAEGYVGHSYTQVSQNEGEVADAIQLAIYLSGNIASVYRDKRDGTKDRRGSKRNRTTLTFGIKKPFVGLRKASFKSIGKREVWCVRTSLGTWTAKQGDNVFLTGNSLPASKMAAAGPDWRTNPATQINWGLGYIKRRYKTPSAAWAHSQMFNWYGEGGDFIASGPQVIGVGEKGPERVSIQPLSGAGANRPRGGGGGGDVHNVTSNVTVGVLVGDEAGLARLTEMIGQRIFEDIQEVKRSSARRPQ